MQMWSPDQQILFRGDNTLHFRLALYMALEISVYWVPCYCETVYLDSILTVFSEVRKVYGYLFIALIVGVSNVIWY